MAHNRRTVRVRSRRCGILSERTCLSLALSDCLLSTTQKTWTFSFASTVSIILRFGKLKCRLSIRIDPHCWLLFVLFVFFSLLFGDSNSNLSNVTHDFVGTRALADVSEFLFSFFFAFRVKVNFALCWFECTRNGSSFRNLSAFLRFERSFVRNSIKNFCFAILANSLRLFFRSPPQAEHWPTQTNAHFKTIFSERPYLLYLNRNQSFLWPSLKEDDEGISQRGKKFLCFRLTNRSAVKSRAEATYRENSDHCDPENY